MPWKVADGDSNLPRNASRAEAPGGLAETHNKFEGLDVTDEDFPAMADIDIHNMQAKMNNKINFAPVFIELEFGNYQK